MYKDYYHLKTEPFSTHPNTGTFFVSNTHKEAWYYLLFGIDTQEPFVVLTGEYGMGKTLLCLRLIKVLKEKGLSRVEYIPTSNEGYGGILRRMASSLEISPIPEDEEILQDMIYERFRTDASNSHFYLIIDDAHELSAAVLTKLKHLSTFNYNEFFPVIIIFVGHPSFLQEMKTPALSSLNQRIKRRYHLARFNFEDTKNYIYFRLMKSGATGIPAFSDETIQKIFEYSGGVPRLINNICDTCLLIGASKQLISIPPSVVADARKLVEGSLPASTTPSRPDPVINEVPADAAPKKDKPQTAITFSADIPADNTISQVPIFSSLDGDEDQPEIPLPAGSGLNKRLSKAITRTVVVLLLILAVFFLYRYYLQDIALTNFISPFTKADPQMAPAPAPTEMTPVEIPILKEEMADKPPVETPTMPPGTESFTAAGATPGQAASPHSQQFTKMEPSSTASLEQPALHSFSLRATSYQQPQRALQEISEIKQLGLNAYLVKVDLGDMGAWWRIYIGFYSSEDEAKKIISTYKLANAQVQKTEYACLAGEFTNETDSFNMFEKLRQAGHFPYVIQKGRNSYRLYLGAYEKKSEAEALQQELQKKGVKSQVVKR